MNNIDWFWIDKRRLRVIKKILNKVNGYAQEIANLSNDELKNKTVVFRERLLNGETLDDLLPEAYAVAREACKRVLGMYPYDVQIMGAIVLHQGNIAEMKTGEGKTLTAVMPLYLNALEQKGTILVTTNSYLALRDYKEMKQVYSFLGVTVSEAVEYGVSEDKKVKPIHKRIAYSADIVYTTNSALAFDYLIDNLASSAEEKYMPSFNYVIIDEVDEVLLDVAQTPLVISGFPRLQSNFYSISNTFFQTLEEDIHYKYNKKKNEVWFTTDGFFELKKFFDLEKVFSIKNKELLRHTLLALRANKTIEKGKEYVVDDDKVKLLDRSSGRILENTKLQLGQHQALEAKEGVKITPNQRAMATITYQNFFKLFKKIAGMTGTAKVSEKEFIKTYNMAVVVIPTNKKMIREDLPDAVYATLPEKIYASVEMLKKYHKEGRPVLLISGNVELSNVYSEILLKEGLVHNVLNAHNVAKEAEIIKDAGVKGAITVATIMAGRGTDIKLGEGVAELGGLVVIGTERMASRRMDLQLIGRSGRQGDPGTSKFFVSLEDSLLAKNETYKTKKYFYQYAKNSDYYNPIEITNKKLLRLVNNSQKISDGSGEASRNMAIEFDESLRLQRSIIYKERDKVIFEKNKNIDKFYNILFEAISNDVSNLEDDDFHTVTRYILDNLTYDYREYDISYSNKNDLKEKLNKILLEEIDKKKLYLQKDYQLNNFFNFCFLKAIDISWLEHVDNLEQLRNIVMSRSVASKNPLFEFYKEADKSFDFMKENIKSSFLKYVCLSTIEYDEKNNIKIVF
ncbi:accessory Sec system translocase SecA2 [Gemelliphila palaticanis]|uniref:Protein translocase subunit SecA n=1 Tax=Gemelliphila palaticanis TaxID=81950 RepID=A0ABX2T468_9BACL|nr:accessory Sec system translocase SecA2 [Gemella palaticanis]MBF0716095.1 accessory Sec system translocase SecA2 [Gemella palaticanis]NYS48025.1 accessory Sec system translocase SecA2 [Gemella palaticanis]